MSYTALIDGHVIAIDLDDKSDCAWLDDKHDRGWYLPKRAAWPLRLWGVRHFRLLLVAERVQHFASRFASVGVGFGHVSPYDNWVLYAISRGWC